MASKAPRAQGQVTPLLVRVEAPHFIAALEIENGRCVRAAPVLAFCLGKDARVLRAYFHHRNWAATVEDPSGVMSVSGYREVDDDP